MIDRRVQINFEPTPGKVYFLYARTDGSQFLSILSPKEWEGERFYEEFIAGVKMNADGDWEPALH